MATCIEKTSRWDLTLGLLQEVVLEKLQGDVMSFGSRFEKHRGLPDLELLLLLLLLWLWLWLWLWLLLWMWRNWVEDGKKRQVVEMFLVPQVLQHHH